MVCLKQTPRRSRRQRILQFGWEAAANPAPAQAPQDGKTTPAADEEASFPILARYGIVEYSIVEYSIV